MQLIVSRSGTYQIQFKIIMSIATNMTEAEKETLIRKLYFNESGFGSPFQIYKEAKATIPTITLNFIRNYFKKQ